MARKKTSSTTHHGHQHCSLGEGGGRPPATQQTKKLSFLGSWGFAVFTSFFPAWLLHSWHVRLCHVLPLSTHLLHLHLGLCWNNLLRSWGFSLPGLCSFVSSNYYFHQDETPRSWVSCFASFFIHYFLRLFPGLGWSKPWEVEFLGFLTFSTPRFVMLVVHLFGAHATAEHWEVEFLGLQTSVIIHKYVHSLLFPQDKTPRSWVSWFPDLDTCFLMVFEHL